MYIFISFNTASSPDDTQLNDKDELMGVQR